MVFQVPASHSTPRSLFRARRARTPLLSSKCNSKRKILCHRRRSFSRIQMDRFKPIRPTVVPTHSPNSSSSSLISSLISTTRLQEASLSRTAGPRWLLSLTLTQSSKYFPPAASSCHPSNSPRSVNKLRSLSSQPYSLCKLSSTIAVGLSRFSTTIAVGLSKSSTTIALVAARSSAIW